MACEEKTILTNMCMVYDDNGNVLVQDRIDPQWPGVTFPGGHVEHGESFVASVIREVKEETGLDIQTPILCGIKQWYAKEDVRYVVLFFKTNRFSGTLRPSKEGEVYWIPKEQLPECKLASDMDEMLEIFESDDLTVSTDERGEKCRVVAVACGCIDTQVTGRNLQGKKMMTPVGDRKIVHNTSVRSITTQEKEMPSVDVASFSFALIIS